jgi:hypothetical protein
VDWKITEGADIESINTGKLTIRIDLHNGNVNVFNAHGESLTQNFPA